MNNSNHTKKCLLSEKNITSNVKSEDFKRLQKLVQKTRDEVRNSGGGGGRGGSSRRGDEDGVEGVSKVAMQPLSWAIRAKIVEAIN